MRSRLLRPTRSRTGIQGFWFQPASRAGAGATTRVVRLRIRQFSCSSWRMTHSTPLIATLVAGLVLAFALGAVAQRLKVSPLVGYLLAGVVIGPFTPGFVADQHIADQLAEIGVILL